MIKIAEKKNNSGKAAVFIIVLLLVIIGFLLNTILKQNSSTPPTKKRAPKITEETSETEPDYIVIKDLDPAIREQLETAKEAINSQRLEEGNELLAPVISEAPDHPEVLFEQAKLLRWQGNRKEAREILENLYPRLRESDDLKYYSLCLYIDILIETLEHDRARELVVEAAELRPDEGWHKELEAHLESIDDRIKAENDDDE